MLGALILNPSFFVLFIYCLSIITFHLFCQCSTSLKLMLITGLPTGKRPSYNFVFGLLIRKTITQGREDKRSGTEKWCSQPLGMIHWTKIPTGLTGKSGPPQKVDHGPVFFKTFISGWTEPIHWVLDRNFQKIWLNGSRPLFHTVFPCMSIFCTSTLEVKISDKDKEDIDKNMNFENFAYKFKAPPSQVGASQQPTWRK